MIKQVENNINNLKSVHVNFNSEHISDQQKEIKLKYKNFIGYEGELLRFNKEQTIIMKIDTPENTGHGGSSLDYSWKTLPAPSYKC